MSGRNALGQEVREFIAIGPNGSPISIKAYAPDPASLGQLSMAGLIVTEGNTKATPTVLSTLQPHGLVTGDTIWLASSDSLPVVNGARVVTVISSTTFSVAVNTSQTNPAATISAISSASPAVVDCVAVHGIVNGATVAITGSDSVPTIDGNRVATVTDTDSFTVPVDTSAGQTFACSTITSAAAAVVTVPLGHLMKTGTQANVTMAASDSVPVVDGVKTATYIDATTFSVPVNTSADQSFNITSVSTASPAVFETAAHLMKTGTTAVTVAGSDHVPDINGTKTATKTGATGFTIPSATTGSFAITGIAIGDPSCVVTCAGGHSLLAGGTSVVIAGTDSTPNINGTKTATYINATTFSVPVATTVVGTTGTITYGRAGSTTGTIAYHRAGTTATAAYHRVGTTGLVSYGHAGTAATTMQPAIVGISISATAPIITTGSPHGLRTGDTVTTAGTDSTPAIDDTYTVTVLTDRTFTVPAATTVVGTTGRLVKVTYSSGVLDRGGATSGGALVITSSIGHATHSVKANIQGCAANPEIEANWWNIPYALTATPRTFVATEITITTSTAATYLLEELVFWRYLRVALNTSTNVGLGITATYCAFP